MKRERVKSNHNLGKFEAVSDSKDEGIFCNICKMNAKTTLNLYNHFIKDHSKLELSLCILNLLKLLVPEDAHLSFDPENRKSSDKDLLIADPDPLRSFKASSIKTNKPLSTRNKIETDDTVNRSEVSLNSFKNEKNLTGLCSESDKSPNLSNSSNSSDGIIDYVVKFYGHDNTEPSKISLSPQISSPTESFSLNSVNEGKRVSVDPTSDDSKCHNTQIPMENVEPAVFENESCLVSAGINSKDLIHGCTGTSTLYEGCNEKDSSESGLTVLPNLLQRQNEFKNGSGIKIKSRSVKANGCDKSVSDLITFSESIVEKMDEETIITESNASHKQEACNVIINKREETATPNLSIVHNGSNLINEVLSCRKETFDSVIEYNEDISDSSSNKDLEKHILVSEKEGNFKSDLEPKETDMKTRKKIDKIILTRKHVKNVVNIPVEAHKKFRLSLLSQKSNSSKFVENTVKLVLDSKDLNVQYTIKRNQTSYSCSKSKKKKSSKVNKSRIKKKSSRTGIESSMNEGTTDDKPQPSSNSLSTENKMTRNPETCRKSFKQSTMSNKSPSSFKTDILEGSLCNAPFTNEDRIKSMDIKNSLEKKIEELSEKNILELNKNDDFGSSGSSPPSEIEEVNVLNQNMFCNSLGLVRHDSNCHQPCSILNLSDLTISNNLKIKQNLYNMDQKLNFRLPIKFFASDDVPEGIFTLELPPFEINAQMNSDNLDKYSLRSQRKGTKTFSKRRKKTTWKKTCSLSCKSDSETRNATGGLSLPHSPTVISPEKDFPAPVSHLAKSSKKLLTEDNCNKVVKSISLSETYNPDNCPTIPSCSTENVSKKSVKTKKDFKDAYSLNEAVSSSSKFRSKEKRDPDSYLSSNSSNNKIVFTASCLDHFSIKKIVSASEGPGTTVTLNNTHQKIVFETKKDHQLDNDSVSCSTKSCSKELEPDSCEKSLIKNKKHPSFKILGLKSNSFNCPKENEGAEGFVSSNSSFKNLTVQSSRKSENYKNFYEGSSTGSRLKFLLSSERGDTLDKDISHPSVLPSNIASKILSKSQSNCEAPKSFILINKSLIAIPLLKNSDEDVSVDSVNSSSTSNGLNFAIVKLIPATLTNEVSLSSAWSNEESIESINSCSVSTDSMDKQTKRNNCTSLNLVALNTKNFLPLSEVDSTASNLSFKMTNTAANVNHEIVRRIKNSVASINDKVNKMKSDPIFSTDSLSESVMKNYLPEKYKRRETHLFSLSNNINELSFFSKLLTMNDLIQFMILNNLQIETESSEIQVTNNLQFFSPKNNISSIDLDALDLTKLMTNGYLHSSYKNDNIENPVESDEKSCLILAGKSSSSCAKNQNDICKTGTDGAMNFCKASKSSKTNQPVTSKNLKIKTKRKLKRVENNENNFKRPSQVKSSHSAMNYHVDTQTKPNTIKNELCDNSASIFCNKFSTNPENNFSSNDVNRGDHKGESSREELSDEKISLATPVSENGSKNTNDLESDSLKLETNDNLNYSIKIDPPQSTTENYKIIMPLQCVALKIPSKTINPPSRSMSLGLKPILQKSVHPNHSNKIAIPRSYKFEAKNSNEITVLKIVDKINKSTNKISGSDEGALLTSDKVNSNAKKEVVFSNEDQKSNKLANFISVSELIKSKDDHDCATKFTKVRIESANESVTTVPATPSALHGGIKLKLSPKYTDIQTANFRAVNALSVVNTDHMENSKSLKVTLPQQCEIGKFNSSSVSNVLSDCSSNSNSTSLQKNKESKLSTMETKKEEDPLHFTLDPDNPRFYCSFCNRGYSKKNHLIRHVRMHMNERPFKCLVCAKGFTTSSILKQHQRLHSGERPYVCSICSKTFSQKSSLLTHTMLHTGKPFKCFYCEDAFVSNHKLLRHLRRHDIDDSLLKCQVCNLQFAVEGAFAAHLRDMHSYPPINKGISFWKNPTGKTVIKDQYLLKKRRRVRKGFYNISSRDRTSKAEI